MKRFTRLLQTSLAFFILTGIYAQKSDNTVAHLKKGDVERFILHYSSITGEFDKLNIKYSPESDLSSFSKSVENISEAESVVKKYGYPDIQSFISQAWAISVTYASIKMETDSTNDYKKAISEIENSTELTEAQKSEAIAHLKQVMDAMKSAFKSMINEEDIETVRPYIKQLDTTLSQE